MGCTHSNPVATQTASREMQCPTWDYPTEGAYCMYNDPQRRSDTVSDVPGSSDHRSRCFLMRFASGRADTTSCNTGRRRSSSFPQLMAIEIVLTSSRSPQRKQSHTKRSKRTLTQSCALLPRAVTWLGSKPEEEGGL